MGTGARDARAVKAWARWRRAGAALLTVLILLVTAWEIRRQAAAMDWEALRTALEHTGALTLWKSLLATAASLLGLALIEAWAVRRGAGLQVPVGTAMAAGAASHALSHVLGWHAVLGPLVRQRAYAAFGAGPSQLVRILLGVGAAVLMGTLATLAIVAAAGQSHPAGWVVAGAVVLLSAWGWRVDEHSIVAGGMRAAGRRLKHAAAIVPIAALETLACLTALWVLVPAGAFASWPAFVLTCLLAQAAGVASHMPGGIGVFEAAMLASAPAESRPGLLAAILAYRALYGLVPLATIALPWLLWSWLQPRTRPLVQLDIG